MGSWLSRPKKPLRNFADLVDGDEYDYVILGSSPSGCVLASRLSEQDGVSVLLVEAGGSDEDYPFTRIPAAWARNLMTGADWKYYTTKQDGCKGRELYWPRGKVLGGSSSINAMIYHHSSPSDYDEWAEILADPSWSYSALTPYFRRAEQHTPHASRSSAISSHPNEHRGTDGVWQTGYGHSTPVMQAFVRACQGVGIPYTPDLNTPLGSLGTTTLSTFLTPRGARSSGSTAYLPPAVLARPNLTVCVRTRCTRIVLSSDGAKAVGVQLADEQGGVAGERKVVKTRREVISCAGTIGSAQLLLLSGVGPREELEQLGIECVKDLPHVGRNLQDHLTIHLLLRAPISNSLDWLSRSPFRSLFLLVRWMLRWGGVMTTNGAEVAAFVRTDDPRLGLVGEGEEKEKEKGEDPTSGPDAPDLEILGAPATFIDHGRVKAPKGGGGVTLLTCLLRPLSKGAITLRSADPWDYPLIDPNYLSHPHDLLTLTRGVALSLRIARTPPLVSMLSLRDSAKQDPNMGSEERDVYAMGDWREGELGREGVEEWVRRTAETIYHPVCTARMGLDPRTSVVDTRLRVHGIAGLRVCDASVFPTILSGHTTAPVIAVAERAVEFVREAWREKQ